MKNKMAKLDMGKTKHGELGSGSDAKSGSGASATSVLSKQDEALTVVSKKSGNPENGSQLFSMAGDMALQVVSKK